MEFKISRPSYLTIIMFFMALKIMTGMVVFEYCVWGASACFFALQMRKTITKEEKIILCLFFILVEIQLIGLIGHPTVFSIKNVISTLGICCCICAAAFYQHRIQKITLSVIYCLLFVFFIWMALSGREIGNTTAASIVFFSILYFIIMLHSSKNKGVATGKLKLGFIYLLLCIGVGYICFASGSRTPLFVAIIIFIVYIFFCLVHFTPKGYQRLFVVFCIAIVVLIAIYINIRSFSWYDKINAYSVELFNKNIDSSRPFLWRTSLQELEGVQWFIGLGTGTLPSIERYANSSFHNSFIQLLMQNGLIGLTCLLLIIGFLWFLLSKRCKSPLTDYIFAVFIGIIIFNCFECTLLQNKTFLGTIQWIIMALGISLERNIVDHCNRQ